jgi:cystathionine beta-lyase/cystathionine gamma-synthase
VPPIHVATTYLRDEDNQYSSGYVYGRPDNATVREAEAVIAMLEEAPAGALLFSSGMAAATALFQALEPGDHVVASKVMYWALRSWLAGEATRWGLSVTFVETDNLEALAAAVQAGRTRLVWIETPSNPRLDVCDIAAISEAAHRAGALVAVDNTLATPLGQQCLALGADIAMMSGTKTLCGHSDVLLGVVSTRDAALIDALKRWRSQSGSVIGPFEAWLAHRSLATLALRLERSSAGALVVAHALRERGVEVFHPSDHAASAQMQHHGCLVGFVLESEARAQEVLARCELVAEATSFGGVHATAERRERWGTDDVPPGFIRYSAGIEDPDDLVADLLRALS